MKFRNARRPSFNLSSCEKGRSGSLNLILKKKREDGRLWCSADLMFADNCVTNANFSRSFPTLSQTTKLLCSTRGRKNAKDCCWAGALYVLWTPTYILQGQLLFLLSSISVSCQLGFYCCCCCCFCIVYVAPAFSYQCCKAHNSPGDKREN